LGRDDFIRVPSPAAMITAASGGELDALTRRTLRRWE
jgi:hypothetical protein